MQNKAPTRVLAMLAAALTIASPSAARAQQRPHLQQSVDVQVPVAPTPVTISGTRYLAYELHITNFRTIDVALTRVEVRGDDNTSLADLRGDALTTKLARPGFRTPPADKRLIAAGMRAIVFQWLPLDPGVATPSTLRHRIELDLMQQSGPEHVTVEARALPVRKETLPTLGPPLRGGPWVALYAPLMERGHRTSIYTIDGGARIPARYAIDWVRLKEDATHASGDESKIANHHGYGADVLAVADAVVAEAADDIAESPSLADAAGAISLENASGNYVTLDLGGQRYAFYEHLKHGSVKVRTGERVKRGQVIGQLGNSGSSSAGPHLHFHVADANSALGAEGMPYVLTGFEVIGAYDQIGDFAENKRWKQPPGDTGGARRMELPDANRVILFPER